METDSYFTYSMPAQLWRRGRIALAQNNQANFCVFRSNQEDSSRSSFFYAALFTTLESGINIRSDTMKPKLFWIQIWWNQTFLIT